MFKLSNIKVSQIKELLTKRVVLIKDVLYYLRPVSISALSQVLNFNWEKERKNFFFLSVDQNIDQELPEKEMQKFILHLGFDFQNISNKHFYEQLQLLAFNYLADDWSFRTLIVTVMGHIDHGKTTLLDVIRSSGLTQQEQGKITQKIGGYQIDFQGEKITFIDTPGHQLFTRMRSQGVNVTDLVILVVAGNEGIKEQTIEAINHAQTAKVPIIVFINKMDLSLSNLSKVQSQLDGYGLNHSLFDNKPLYLSGSCLQKVGIDQLLTTLCQIKSKLPLEVNFNCLVKAVVLDCWVNRQGIQVTIIIQKGTLQLQDLIIVDNTFGKVRAIINDLGQHLIKAVPGMCVVVLGLNNSVETGSLLFSFPDSKLVVKLAKNFPLLVKNDFPVSHSIPTNIDLETLWSKNDSSQIINLVVKLDTKGSEQVLLSQIEFFNKRDGEKLKLHFVHVGVGTVNLNDLNLVIASEGLLLTFNLRLSSLIANKIKEQKTTFYNFTVFSHFFDYLDQLRKGKLVNQIEEKIVGQAEVIKIFNHSKLGVIAGCVVRKGVVKTGVEKIKVLRNNQEITTGLKIKSLKHEKENIKLAVLNQEFGIIFDNFNDLQVGDQIHQFTFASFDEK